MTRQFTSCLAVLAALLVTPPILAQDEAVGAEEAAASEQAPIDVAAKLAEMEERLKSQQEQIDAQNQKIEELEAEPGEGGDLEFDEEDDFSELEGVDIQTEDIFNIYGFFDLGFYKAFVDKHSPYYLFIGNASTFVMTNLNVYFSSQMTETLSALVELRFSFYPTGQGESSDQYIHVGDSTIQVSEFKRRETTVWDFATVQEFRQGGLTIERVHLNYEPVDWFNILAGRYITPYGIWNVDHGSPVILTVRTPYMFTRAMVPNAQTGVQVYGRFYPRYDLFFDYAITLSNGRGPMSEVMDLDENKALGLRLALSYEGDDVFVAAGTYGYMGEYTDSNIETHLEMINNEDGQLVLDESAEQPISTRANNRWGFYEYAVSADLKMNFWGVGLQGEFMLHYVDITHPDTRRLETNLFAGAPADMPLYTPSFVGYDVYGLLSWELPLDKWISPVTITPYAMYEWSTSDDTTPFTNFHFILAGLNVRPSPYVTLKGEYFRAIPETDLYGEDLHGIYFQMAVTF